MSDESILPRLEEWMEMMTFYIPPDNLKRILCNEKTKSILIALNTYVRPKEMVKKAKHILLTKKQSGKEPCKELELMKKRNKLKEQLQHREKEFAEKKKEYTKLVKENENLLQEIQRTDSILNDEKKKLLFLLLNEKALDDTTVQYHLLRQCVHEAKEMENKKKEKTCLMKDSSEVREAVHECQTYIMSTRKRMEEQLENIQNIASEYGCNGTNTIALDWKLEIIEYVTKKLEKIPLCRVFDILIEQQQQIMISIQHLSSCTHSDSSPEQSKKYGSVQDRNHFKALERNFFISSYVELNGLTDIKSSSQRKQLVNNLRASVTNHNEDSVDNHVMEDFIMSESSLLDIENHIAEKATECRNLKLNLKTNLSEVKRRLSGIKQFCRKLQNSTWQGHHTEDPQLVPQTNEMYNCMQELCTLGPKEIQLLATLPLVALEKLCMENGKCVSVHGLLSSYLRVLPHSSEYSKSTFSEMDAPGLTPYFLLIHVWKQLSYLGELQKAHSLMMPFAGTCTNLRVEPEEISEKLEQIHDNFLSILSPFASKSDEIVTLLEIMRHHPLLAVVPRDLLVEGQSFQFYVNLFNKAKGNENNFPDITEEHGEEM